MLGRPADIQFRRGKAVSDAFLKQFMESVASLLASRVTVHSGDRHHIPKGGAKKSLHLSGRAADFHIDGMSDAEGFRFLWLHKAKLPSSEIDRYQVLHHGAHTETEAEHLHLGHYQMVQALVVGPGITFLVEGQSPGTRGRYAIYTG